MARHDGKILMIDDEQDLLKLSSSILRREGFCGRDPLGCT